MRLFALSMKLPFAAAPAAKAASYGVSCEILRSRYPPLPRLRGIRRRRIRPLWHGLCVLANIMAQGRTTFAVFIAVGFILVFPHQVPAQPSTAPPSSLSTRPLAPGATESELRGSCDLCRKPVGRPGSDLRPQRLRREKGLRPHKKAKGTHR